jgi:CubicO group peptidase (beta-lactamase class C family)
MKFLKTFMKNAKFNMPPSHGGNPNSNPSGYPMSSLDSPPSFFKFDDEPPFTPRLLESATIEVMLTPYFSYYPDLYQGLVWRYYEGGTYPIWGHSGSTYGASTEMWYAPEKEVGVVVLTNGEADLYEITKAIFLYGYGL